MRNFRERPRILQKKEQREIAREINAKLQFKIEISCWKMEIGKIGLLTQGKQ